MSAPVIRAGQRGRPQGGPPPLVPALAYGALMIAAVAVSAGGTQPGTSAAGTLSYAQAHAGQLHVSQPLAWAGLVIAAAGMLSTLTLLTSALDATLPIGRFGGLIWIVAVSALLPASRHQLTARAGEPAPAAGAIA